MCTVNYAMGQQSTCQHGEPVETAERASWAKRPRLAGSTQGTRRVIVN